MAILILIVDLLIIKILIEYMLHVLAILIQLDNIIANHSQLISIQIILLGQKLIMLKI